MVSKGFPNVITSGRQYNIGEKPSVILYTYIYFVWCTYMVINGSVSYDGGLLPDIILLISSATNCLILIILLS